MQPPPGMGYDMVTTMFSPDGRIFQVEYARESVKRGSTSVGIKYRKGVVLAAQKRITGRMVLQDSIEKMFQIDDHIGVVSSGMVADTRVLVDRMRVKARDNRRLYNEPVGLHTLAKGICDFMQLYTHYGGVRPFGTSLLVAGVDPAVGLYETDPSGALTGYMATAIGEGRRGAMEFLEEKYTEDMDRDEAIKMALDALGIDEDIKLTEESVDLAIIDKDGYTKCSKEEVKGYIATLESKI